MILGRASYHAGGARGQSLTRRGESFVIVRQDD